MAETAPRFIAQLEAELRLHLPEKQQQRSSVSSRDIRAFKICLEIKRTQQKTLIGNPYT